MKNLVVQAEGFSNKNTYFFTPSRQNCFPRPDWDFIWELEELQTGRRARGGGCLDYVKRQKIDRLGRQSKALTRYNDRYDGYYWEQVWFGGHAQTLVISNSNRPLTSCSVRYTWSTAIIDISCEKHQHISYYTTSCDTIHQHISYYTTCAHNTWKIFYL